MLGITLAADVSWYESQTSKLVNRFCSQGLLGGAAERNELVRATAGRLVWASRRAPRRFGRVLPGEIAQCARVAQAHGIILDPIYSLAAWEAAEELASARAEQHASDPQQRAEGQAAAAGGSDEAEEVVMLHTGGMLGHCGLAQRFPDEY